MAQIFQATFRRTATPHTRKKFDEFAATTGGLKFRLNTSVVPDAELDLICKLYNPDNRGGSQNVSEDEKVKRMKRRLEFSE